MTQKTFLTLNNYELDDLLTNCSYWPWSIGYEETNVNGVLAGDWRIRSAAYVSKIIGEVNGWSSAYDRRLAALAPLLAAEVLHLRKELERSRS